MRVQACCAERGTRWAFPISDASFLLLRGSVTKRDAADLQTPSSLNEPGVRGPAQCSLDQFGRNGLTVDKERDARPQFLLCGTRIRQVPLHQSSVKPSFNLILLLHKTAND